MDVKPKMAFEPGFVLGMFVCGVVIDNPMQVQYRQCFGVDHLEAK